MKRQQNSSLLCSIKKQVMDVLIMAIIVFNVLIQLSNSQTNVAANLQPLSTFDTTMITKAVQTEQQVYQSSYDLSSSPSLKWLNIEQQTTDEEEEWDDRDSCIDLDWEQRRFKIVHSPLHSVISQHEPTVWNIDDISRLRTIDTSIHLNNDEPIYTCTEIHKYLPFINPTPNTLHFSHSTATHTPISSIAHCRGYEDVTIEASFIPSKLVGFYNIYTTLTHAFQKLEPDEKIQVNVTFKILFIPEHLLESKKVMKCTTDWFSFDVKLNNIRTHPFRHSNNLEYKHAIILQSPMVQPLLVNKNYGDEDQKKNLVVVFAHGLTLANPTNETIYITQASTSTSIHHHDMNLSVKLLVRENDLQLPNVEEALVDVWTLRPFEVKRVANIQISNHYSLWKNHLDFENTQNGLRTIGYINVRTTSPDPIYAQITIPVSFNFTTDKADTTSHYHARQWLDFGTFIYPSFSNDIENDQNALQKRTREISLLFHSKDDLAYEDISIETEDVDPQYADGFRHMQVVLLNSQRRENVHNERCVRIQQSNALVQAGTQKCPHCTCHATYPTSATIGVATFTAPTNFINHTAFTNQYDKDEMIINGKFKLRVWKGSSRSELATEVIVQYKARVLIGRLDYKLNQTLFHVATDTRLSEDQIIGAGKSFSLTWDDIQDNSQFQHRDIYLVNRFHYPLQFYHSTVAKPVTLTSISLSGQTTQQAGLHREMASPLTTSVALASMYQFTIDSAEQGLLIQPNERKRIVRLTMHREFNDPEKQIPDQHKFMPFLMKHNLINQVVKYTTSITLHTNISRLYIPLHVVAHPVSFKNLSFVAVDGLVNPTLYGAHVSKRDIHLGTLVPGTGKSHLFVLVNEQTDFVIDVSDWQVLSVGSDGHAKKAEFTLSVVTIYKVSSTDPECKDESCHDDSSTRFSNNGSLPFQLDPGYRALMKLTVQSSSDPANQHLYNGTLLIRYKLTPTTEYMGANVQQIVENSPTPSTPPSFSKLLSIPLQYYVLNGNVTFKQTTFAMGSTFRGPAGPILKDQLVVSDNTLVEGGKRQSDICINITRAISTDSRFTLDVSKGCLKKGQTAGTIIFDPRKRNFRDYSTLHLSEDPFDYMTLTAVKPVELSSTSLTMRTAKVSMSTSKSDDFMTMMDDDDLDDYPLNINAGDVLDELDNLISEEEENEELVGSLLHRCRRMIKYSDLAEEQKRLSATITLETSISRKFTLELSGELVVPRLQFINRRSKSQYAEQIRIGLTRMGSSKEIYIRVKNPSTKPIRIQRILIGDSSLSSLLSHCGAKDATPIDEAKLRDKWDELVFNTTIKGSKESEIREKEFTLAKKRVGTGLIIPGFGEYTLGPVIYTPKSIQRSDAVIYIMNNLTFADWITVSGVGASGQLLFSAPSDLNAVNINDTNADQQASFLRIDALDWPIGEEALGKWENGGFKPKVDPTNPNQPIAFTTKFGFANSGNLKIFIWDVSINGRGCEVYGLRLHRCKEYSKQNVRALHPGQRSVMKMTFTPDFTTSEVNLTIHFTVQSVMHPTQVSKSEDPIDHIELPIRITLPRKILPYLHDVQRRSWNTIPLMPIDEMDDVVAASALTIIVTNVIWVVRWMITVAVFSAAVYVVAVTSKEWILMDFGIWRKSTSSSRSNDGKIEDISLDTQSGSKSEEPTKIEKQDLSVQKKAQHEIETIMKRAENGPTVSPPDDEVETPVIIAERTDDKTQESASVPSKPATPELFLEVKERPRAASDTEPYIKPKKKKSDKKNKNNSTKSNRNITPIEVPKVASPVHQPTSPEPKKIQQVSILKRKTSGGKSAATEVPPKVPEKILLRSTATPDGTAQPILKKIKQINQNNEQVISLLQEGKKDRNNKSNGKKNNSSKDQQSNGFSNQTVKVIDNQQKEIEALEHQRVIENTSPDSFNQWPHQSQLSPTRNISPPARCRSVSPTQPSRSRPTKDNTFSRPTAEQQQGSQLIDRLTLAFQPARQESPGYFSLFSEGSAGLGGSAWGTTANDDLGLGHQQQHQQQTNSIMNPFASNLSNSAPQQNNGLGSFDPLGYGAFGHLGSVARERSFIPNDLFRDRIQNFNAGTSNSFFSYSPSRFTFITPIRAEYEEEELNEFDLDPSSSETVSSSSSPAPDSSNE